MTCSRGAVNTGREAISILTRSTITGSLAPRAGGIIISITHHLEGPSNSNIPNERLARILAVERIR